MEEQELYKLVADPEGNSYVDEYGWINDKEFCVWVAYLWLPDFLQDIEEIFGNSIFDDGGFNGNFQQSGVCIDLCEVVGSAVDIEAIFPKHLYPH